MSVSTWDDFDLDTAEALEVAQRNGATEPVVKPKPPPNRTEDEIDRFILEQPEEAQRMLDGYSLLSGKGAKAEREDLRFGSIPTTRHLDQRRYVLGIDNITMHMGPLRAGELVVVGSREGNGKTAFAERLAMANARDHKVLFATLEMTREEIRDRMVAKKLGIGLNAVAAEQTENSQRYRDARMLIAGYDLLVWHPSNGDRRVEAITKRAVDTSADLLVIDYTRKIAGWEPGKEAGRIMDFLGQFVRESNITTVLLAQLNRAAAQVRPHNAFFQDTGKLEQAADRCLLLYRPFLGQPTKDTIAEVIVSKNRQGPAFRAHTHWRGETMDFYEMDDLDQENAPCCRNKGKGLNA